MDFKIRTGISSVLACSSKYYKLKNTTKVAAYSLGTVDSRKQRGVGELLTGKEGGTNSDPSSCLRWRPPPRTSIKAASCSSYSEASSLGSGALSLPKGLLCSAVDSLPKSTSVPVSSRSTLRLTSSVVTTASLWLASFDAAAVLGPSVQYLLAPAFCPSAGFLPSPYKGTPTPRLPAPVAIHH